jgi:hypothetical protein
VVSIAVNDEHRASHAGGDSMEPRGSHPESSKRGEFAGATPRRPGYAVTAGYIANVGRAVAEIVDDGGDEAAAATRRRKEATGENDTLYAVGMRDGSVQRLNGSE